jgi:prevent-host-death family protein
MSKTITATELRQNIHQVLTWTRIEGETVVIQSHGRPLAAILPYGEYEMYEQFKQNRAARFAQVRQTAALNAAANQLTEAEAMALVEQERQAVNSL